MTRPTVIAARELGPEDPTEELELELDDELDDDAAPGSVLAQLRAAAEVQRQSRTLELAVGGALDALVIRYRMLTRHEWDRYSVLLTPSVTARGPDTGKLPPMSVLNARMMATACETVLWRGEDGELSDLEVQLDGRLARMLGHPLAPGVDYDDLAAPDVIEAVFGGNWMAVTSHAGELAQWMQDPTGGAEGEA